MLAAFCGFLDGDDGLGSGHQPRFRDGRTARIGDAVRAFGDFLQRALHFTQAARSEPAAIFAFDLLILGGRDMRKLPLLKRKDALQKALGEPKRIRSVQHVGEMGQRLYDAACGLSLEGIVAKRADAPYTAGRSRDWIKIRTPHGRHLQEQRSEQWDG